MPPRVDKKLSCSTRWQKDVPEKEERHRSAFSSLKPVQGSSRCCKHVPRTVAMVQKDKDQSSKRNCLKTQFPSPLLWVLNPLSESHNTKPCKLRITLSTGQCYVNHTCGWTHVVPLVPVILLVWNASSLVLPRVHSLTAVKIWSLLSHSNVFFHSIDYHQKLYYSMFICLFFVYSTRPRHEEVDFVSVFITVFPRPRINNAWHIIRA